MGNAPQEPAFKGWKRSGDDEAVNNVAQANDSSSKGTANNLLSTLRSGLSPLHEDGAVSADTQKVQSDPAPARRPIWNRGGALQHADSERFHEVPTAASGARRMIWNRGGASEKSTSNVHQNLIS